MLYIEEFLDLARDLEGQYPFLYVEIARTRTTDWMAWLRVRPDGDLLAFGQCSTPNEACKQALEQYKEQNQ